MNLRRRLSSGTNSKGGSVTEKCEEILDTAKGLITGDRNKVYGDAREDFTRTGKLWEQVLGVEVPPEKVAMCMALVKFGRLTNSPDHEDSWVDAAGYIALGGEIATVAPVDEIADPPVTVDRLTEAEKHWVWENRNGNRYRWRDCAWWIDGDVSPGPKECTAYAPYTRVTS
jgi:hypothetical protein